MTTPDGLPPLREVIRRHGLSARKSFGQNFILDLNVTRRIARAAGPLEGLTVVEVGAGPGGLTRALLLEGAERVIAIERDRRCIPALEEVATRYPGRLRIEEADALRVDYAALAGGRRARIVANLPYNIASALLVGWLEAAPWPPWYEKAALMFQLEVAERIVAAPGGKVYGRLSVLAQWRAAARILLRLPPRAFTPAPKVESALVEIAPHPQPQGGLAVADLARLTAAAFGQRRKMLRASLRQLRPDADRVIAAAGLDPALRAEQLTVADYRRLADAFKAASAAS